MKQEHDSDEAPSPEESLRLIGDQRARTQRSVEPDPLVYWGPWGAAWFIAFGMFFLRYGLGNEPIVSMPYQVPLIVLFALMAVAMVITVFAGAKANRDFQGVSNTQGMMYGFSWTFAFISVVAVNLRFSPQLSTDETGLLWAATSVGLVAALYMAGGAMWRTWTMFGMGAWLIVINAVGVLLGPGWHALLVSVAGGLGLILAGLVMRIYHRGRSQ